jgi:hypothetical protein
MSTRENMRRELKELAKLAETIGKEPVAESAPVRQEPYESPQRLIERPSTPQSLSTFTVPPVSPSMGAEAFVEAEAPRIRKRRGRGVVAIAIAVGLAGALVGGAQLGRSLAFRLTKPAAKTVAAAAAMPAPQPAVADISHAPAIPAPVQPTAPAVETPSVPATPTAPSASSPALASSPKAKISAPHHWSKPSTSKAAVATPEATPAADTGAPSAPKPVAAKPAAAANNAPPAAAGGGDSLEDLIRKAVAASPKK